MSAAYRSLTPIVIQGRPSSSWTSTHWDDVQATELVSKSGVVYYVSSQVSGTVSAVNNAVSSSQGEGDKNKLVKLNNSGRLDDSFLPPLAITSVTVAATAPTNVQSGDVFINTSDGKSYIYTGAAWQELISSGSVVSVNGKTGTVSLGAGDVGALASSALVTSVSSTSLDTQVPSALSVYTFASNANNITTGTLGSERLPLATTTGTVGAASFNSDSFSVDANGKVILKAATSSNLGGVKVSTGIKNSSGTISADFISSIPDNSTNTTKIPTPASVHSYVENKTWTSSKITGTISTAGGITSSEAALVQARAVHAYVQAQASSDSVSGVITGNGSASTFNIVHSLGAKVFVQVVKRSTGEIVFVPTVLSNNKVVFTFSTAPSSGTVFDVFIRKCNPDNPIPASTGSGT